MGAPFPVSLLYMAWTTPLFDRPAYNKAGHAFLNVGLSEAALDEALEVVNNWRSAHAYPLQCIKMTLVHRAQKVDSTAIIAQRLKRLASIQAKLSREPTMKLTQMQDIGGCRAIVSSIRNVDRLLKIYEEARAKNPRGRSEQTSMKDYISAPKPDGYRGIHLVYRYKSGSEKHSVYNEQKIEIQIRSRLQHAWATAVEIVDAFTGQAIKSGLKLNLGDPVWRRFFVLMSSAIAERERRPVVPGASTDRKELKAELKKLAAQLQVKQILSGLNTGMDIGQELGKKYPDTTVYLLVLNLAENRVNVGAYSREELPSANEAYLKIEKENKDSQQVLAVLVSVESMKNLRAAYPNYYLDSTEFIKALDQAIG